MARVMPGMGRVAVMAEVGVRMRSRMASGVRMAWPHRRAVAVMRRIGMMGGVVKHDPQAAI